MPGAIQVLLSGFALGISIAAPPGPVSALAAREVVTRSWLDGWLVAAGATAADGVFFVMTYLGIARMASPKVRDVLFLAGGLFMLYLAFSTVKKARRREGTSTPSRTSSFSGSPLLMGLSIGITSPFQLAWWVAIGAGMISEFGSSIAIGFFAGIIAWTLFFTALVHEGVTRYERLAPMIAYASALLIGGFGLWFLFVGISTTIL